MGELNQVADGVWVRQSEWVWTNSIVVRGEEGLILIDPGIHGSELEQLADAVDRLSDSLVPMFDSRQDDQVGAYETALARLDEAASHVDVVVPGHGAVAEGPDVAARLAADHAYVDALRRGEEPVDARLDADWLSGIHLSNLEQARGW